MSNFVTLRLKLCEPAPVAGYRVLYRPEGSAEPLRVWPVNFFTTPIVFEVTADADGTQYEGFVEGDCGPAGRGVEVSWQTGTNDHSSGSASEPPPPLCGQFVVTNDSGEEQSIFFTQCDGSTPAFPVILGPGESTTVCVPENALGQPLITLPTGVNAVRSGPCTLYTDALQYSSSFGTISGTCTMQLTISRTNDATAAAASAGKRVKVSWSGTSNAIDPCTVTGFVIFEPTDHFKGPTSVDVSCGAGFTHFCTIVTITLTAIEVVP